LDAGGDDKDLLIGKYGVQAQGRHQSPVRAPGSRAAPVPALLLPPRAVLDMHHRSSRTFAQQLTLAPHPAAVPWVRRLAGQVLREWGLEELTDTALLLVSELVTNAVRASSDGDWTAAGSRDASPEVALTLRLTASRLVIAVWDGRPDPAVRQRPDATTDSGRGLMIVEALAGAWGQRAVDGGKEVWCEVSLPPAAVVSDGPAVSLAGQDALPGADCSRHPDPRMPGLKVAFSEV
jgi:anti-sigma regulatory factor (Ser/Thr protein kinase)